MPPQKNKKTLSIHSVCFHCAYSIPLHSHDLTPAQIHKHAHATSGDETCALGIWYSTCRGSSRRSAWSSFCINHSDCCCCLTARLTACNSTSAQVATGSEDSSDHSQRAHIACSSSAHSSTSPSLPCVFLFVCPLAVEHQMTNNPDKTAALLSHAQ